MSKKQENLLWGDFREEEEALKKRQFRHDEDLDIGSYHKLKKKEALKEQKFEDEQLAKKQRDESSDFKKLKKGKIPSYQKFKNNFTRQVIYVLCVYSLLIVSALVTWQLELVRYYIGMSQFVVVIGIFIGINVATAIRDQTRDPKYWMKGGILSALGGGVLSYMFLVSANLGEDWVSSNVIQYLGLLFSFLVFIWIWQKGSGKRSVLSVVFFKIPFFPIFLFGILAAPFFWLLLNT